MDTGPERQSLHPPPPLSSPEGSGRRWARMGVGVGLLAAIAAWIIIPTGSTNNAGDQAVEGVRRVLAALAQYARDHDGRLPHPDRIVPTMIEAGAATEETFRLGGSSMTAFYFVMPEPGALPHRRPMVYSNPRFRADQSIAVGFADNHVERLSPVQSKSFLASVAPRAVPLK